VGEGSVLKGEITVDGYFRLNGDLIGNLDCTGRVLVAETGRFKGTLHANEVVIGGAVKGDIFATGVVKLLAGALVLGNIYAPRLILEEKAIFEGYGSINPEMAKSGLSARDFQPQGYFTLDLKKKKDQEEGEKSDSLFGDSPWIR
jgi:cytoskeletal protein CcmA (bactofilin family)